MRSAWIGAGAIGILLAVAGCGPAPIDPNRQIGANPYLPPIHEYLLPPMHVAKVVGWNGATPTAAAGLKVQAFATGLANPRSLYVLPNGDVLVVEAGAGPSAQGDRHELGREDGALPHEAWPAHSSVSRLQGRRRAGPEVRVS
jgi:glucose/arabinose dehydrogenase